MQPDLYKRMTELCEKIQSEKDQKELTRLIEELNRLLEGDGNPDPPKNKYVTASTA
jgi:hypothetical protein